MNDYRGYPASPPADVFVSSAAIATTSNTTTVVIIIIISLFVITTCRVENLLAWKGRRDMYHGKAIPNDVTVPGTGIPAGTVRVG